MYKCTYIILLFFYLVQQPTNPNPQSIGSARPPELTVFWISTLLGLFLNTWLDLGGKPPNLLNIRECSGAGAIHFFGSSHQLDS